MGTIKGISCKSLIVSEEIKMRWIEYPEELYRKDLNEVDYYDGVVWHPVPDILECEVKWALGSTAINKVGRCNEILAEILKSLKDDAIKV